MKRRSARLRLPEELPALVGVNFWSRAGGPRMWREYNGPVITEELRQLREYGITHTRSFLYWPDFQPEPNALSDIMLTRLEDFLRRHVDADMRTIPTFIVGHMSGQNWDPVWRDGCDVFEDVWFVARQAWYVREIVSRFHNSPAIAGWLLTNEVPIYADQSSHGIGTINASAVASWAQILIDAVRAGGGSQPVSIGDGAWGVEVTGNDNGFRVRDLEPLVDFLGPHVYGMEDDQVRQHLGAAFICELLQIGDTPVVLEEFGVTSDYADDANAAHYYRQILHNTLLAGATGWIPWNNTDYDPFADREPYSHHPFEMHFGLVDAEGRPKAQLLEVRDFVQTLHDLQFGQLQRRDATTALLVSSYLEAEYPFTDPEDGPTVFHVARQAYAAAREADLDIGVAREKDGIPEETGLIIVPSTKALLATTWPQLEDRAANGATVYASYFNGAHGNQRGSWWPNLDQLFGVHKHLQYGLVNPVEGREVAITFERDFGGIALGTTLHFAVSGSPDGRSHLPIDATEAEIVATDSAGAPAITRRRVGAGSMILAIYPFEYFASSAARVNPEPTWRLYAALAADAGVQPEVGVEDPSVLTGTMQHCDGRVFVWLISQSWEPKQVVPKTNATLYRRNDGRAVSRIELAPYGVEIFELRAG